jgi:hypothetical protein
VVTWPVTVHPEPRRTSLQPALAAPQRCRRRARATPIRTCVYFTLPVTPGVWVSPLSLSWLGACEASSARIHPDRNRAATKPNRITFLDDPHPLSPIESYSCKNDGGRGYARASGFDLPVSRPTHLLPRIPSNLKSLRTPPHTRVSRALRLPHYSLLTTHYSLPLFTTHYSLDSIYRLIYDNSAPTSASYALQNTKRLGLWH